MHSKKRKRLNLEKNETLRKNVVETDKQTEQLCTTELEKLFLWKSAPQKKMGIKQRFKELSSFNQPPPRFQIWKSDAYNEEKQKTRRELNRFERNCTGKAEGNQAEGNCNSHVIPEFWS